MSETMTQNLANNDARHTDCCDAQSDFISIPELPRKSVRPKRSSERKQKQEQLDRHDGREDAQKWLGNAHPVMIINLLKYVGEDHDRFRKVWQSVPSEFFPMKEQVEARGKTYWEASIAQVRRQWTQVKRVWTSFMYQKGIDDGHRWATEIAQPELVDRLRQKFDADPVTLLPSYEDYFDGYPTPAQKLLIALLGDEYPRLPFDEDYGYAEPDPECKEFKEFWQPFVEEPMDLILKDYALCFISKLSNPNYVSGFLDGASGISEVFARKFALGCK